MFISDWTTCYIPSGLSEEEAVELFVDILILVSQSHDQDAVARLFQITQESLDKQVSHI